MYHGSRELQLHVTSSLKCRAGDLTGCPELVALLAECIAAFLWLLTNQLRSDKGMPSELDEGLPDDPLLTIEAGDEHHFNATSIRLANGRVPQFVAECLRGT